MRILLLIFTGILLTSCTSLQNDRMSTISNPIWEEAEPVTPIILRESFSFNVKPTIGRVTMTIKAGTYFPIGNNEVGSFYIGPKDCLLTEGNLMVSFTSHCGLFVKKNIPDVIYFFYFDSGYETANKSFWNFTELQKYKSNDFHIDTEHPIPVKQLNILGL